MSQIFTESAEPIESTETPYDPADEFAYRPVPPLAPISLFLGICAVSGFVGIPCLAFGFVGVVLGAVALWQIRRSEGYLGGKVIACLGAGLSTIMLVAGSGYHAYDYVTELPEGYQRISFPDLAKHEPKNVGGKPEVGPEVAELDGKPIFIKGYMYPDGPWLTGISEFCAGERYWAVLLRRAAQTDGHDCRQIRRRDDGQSPRTTARRSRRHFSSQRHGAVRCADCHLSN